MSAGADRPQVDAQEQPVDARRWGWPRWADVALTAGVVVALSYLAEAVGERLGRPEWSIGAWALVLSFVAAAVVGTCRGERIGRRAADVLGAQARSGRLDVRVTVRTSPYFVGPAPRGTTRLVVAGGDLRLGDGAGGYLWPGGTWSVDGARGWSARTTLHTPNGEVRLSLLPRVDLASFGTGRVDEALAAALSQLRHHPRPVAA